MAILPTITRCFSVASCLKNFLYISNVKIVEMLLAFPASEATMAAVRAESTPPERPMTTRSKPFFLT